ncbi:MAG: biotin attachment protein [Acidobacteria bacterium]|nr:biotin attachment protein [Acidobacteriota bacterium]|tara:strand:- start:31 stop:1830 length:1800 start_codon:yes stop_codon:yes gene_type:complete
MAKRRIAVMNTAFRDGFQSVYGARVLTADFIPAVEAARHAGFTHFEAGGGARYQSLYLYCNEDAFDMMDAFRAAAGPDANLQTLARGVNVVGLDSQPSDIIELHAKMFKKHGITTIRNFDAMNDVRNLSYSGQCIADAGLNHEVVVALMELPPGAKGEGAHTPEFYTGILRSILDADVPFTSVCYKDASGTSVPSKIYESIKQARQLLGDSVEIRLHTHETAGVSLMQYKAALDAGADGIDLCMAPVSGGTSQPDVIAMWHALRGTDYDLGLDIDKVLEASEVFKECMKDYLLPLESKIVDPWIPYSPMPGGALTTNTQMMRDNNLLDRYPEVIKAMSEVVRRGGFGTSVTPVSQFYFQQAFNNVIFGPWKRIADGYGKMVLGYFGKPPVSPDAEVVRIAHEQSGLPPTTEDPRALNDADSTKGIGAATSRLVAAGLPVTDENIFISASLTDKGVAFLKGEGALMVRKSGPEENTATTPDSNRYAVTVKDTVYNVSIEGTTATVNGHDYPFDVAVGTASEERQAGPAGDGTDVLAELPGKVVRLVVNEGDSVKSGDTLLVLEALKMEIEVSSPASGTVTRFDVRVGSTVVAGDLLAVVA